jgi:transcription antitermination factor NusG
VPYPLLPRYVVAGFTGWDDWYRVTGATRRALGLVGVRQGEPRALSAQEVAWMEKMVARTRAHKDRHETPQVGDAAQIIEGPFAGHTVKVEDIDRDQAKALLVVLNAMRVVEIPVSALQPA